MKTLFILVAALILLLFAASSLNEERFNSTSLCIFNELGSTDDPDMRGAKYIGYERDEYDCYTSLRNKYKRFMVCKDKQVASNPSGSVGRCYGINTAENREPGSQRTSTPGSSTNTVCNMFQVNSADDYKSVLYA